MFFVIIICFLVVFLFGVWFGFTLAKDDFNTKMSALWWECTYELDALRLGRKKDAIKSLRHIKAKIASHLK